MNDRVYEEARWNTGLGVRLAGWVRAVRERLDANAGPYAATRESRRARAGVDLEELARQEEIRLVQRLFLAPGSKRRVVLFTGVDGDNGCAQLCIRAGQALARLTVRPVCVVDADVRTPAPLGLSGADAHPGLTAAVDCPDAARTLARRLTPDNLWLLPSGGASDPDVLLTTDRMQQCLRELCLHFDHIIINTAPINLYAESLALSHCVDGVLLVLEANVTRREIVRRVKTRLEDLNVPLLGVVLNNRTFPIPDALYRLL